MNIDSDRYDCNNDLSHDDKNITTRCPKVENNSPTSFPNSSSTLSSLSLSSFLTSNDLEESKWYLLLFWRLLISTKDWRSLFTVYRSILFQVPCENLREHPIIRDRGRYYRI